MFVTVGSDSYQRGIGLHHRVSRVLVPGNQVVGYGMARSAAPARPPPGSTRYRACERCRHARTRSLSRSGRHRSAPLSLVRKASGSGRQVRPSVDTTCCTTSWFGRVRWNKWSSSPCGNISMSPTSEWPNPRGVYIVDSCGWRWLSGCRSDDTGSSTEGMECSNPLPSVLPCGFAPTAKGGNSARCNWGIAQPACPLSGTIDLNDRSEGQPGHVVPERLHVFSSSNSHPSKPAGWWRPRWLLRAGQRWRSNYLLSWQSRPGSCWRTGLRQSAGHSTRAGIR